MKTFFLILPLLGSFSSLLRADLIDSIGPQEKPTSVSGLRPKASKDVNPSGFGKKVERSKGAPKKKAGASSKALASTKRKTERKEQGSFPVKFRGEGLRAKKDERFILLKKDVVVEQGDFKLTADEAKIFFVKGSRDVERVVALGSVKISKVALGLGERVTTRSKKAEFIPEKQVIVLEGEARLTRGADIIEGYKVVYNLESEEVEATEVRGAVKEQNIKKD